MARLWSALPVKFRSYVQILLSMWMSVAGLAAITWGVCIFLLPMGIITGGLCALLLDRAIDMTLTKGDGR